MQAYQDIGKGAAQWVTTDFFDTDSQNKIIEHWDVIAPYYNATPSGHTAIDGATEIADLDKTEQNKNTVRAFIENVLMAKGKPENARNYLAQNYIEHNQYMADGVESFIAAFDKQGGPLLYNDIVLCVGAGNFVATLSKTTWTGRGSRPAGKYAEVDIFRIADGQIVEHWDNMEPVPDNDVNGGKF